MPDEELPDDTFEIGYREDGLFWVTASRKVTDADAAERYMGPGWKVVAEVFLGPTGRWVNSKDPEWEECDPEAPEARRGWRLMDTSMPEYFDGDWTPNPHHRR